MAGNNKNYISSLLTITLLIATLVVSSLILLSFPYLSNDNTAALITTQLMVRMIRVPLLFVAVGLVLSLVLMALQTKLL